MTRFAVALLLALLPAAYGFGVAVRPSRTMVFAPNTVAFMAPPVDDDIVPDSEEFFMEDVESLEEEIAPTIFKENAKVAEFADKAKSTFEDLSSKAQDFANSDRVKDITTKAKDFANDERVQDIAGKAQDFAKDVVGQLFSSVGDKLKEMKKEKEESNAE